MSDILQDAQDNLRRDADDMESSRVDPGDIGADFDNATVNPTARISDMLPDMSFLLAKTGSGSIDDYMDHPFNGQQSRGMAQMLRGVTGIAGELDYAIVDIALGAVNYIREGKQHAQTNSRE